MPRIVERIAWRGSMEAIANPSGEVMELAHCHLYDSLYR
jgi:hypothetical protein